MALSHALLCLWCWMWVKRVHTSTDFVSFYCYLSTCIIFCLLNQRIWCENKEVFILFVGVTWLAYTFTCSCKQILRHLFVKVYNNNNISQDSQVRDLRSALSCVHVTILHWCACSFVSSFDTCSLAVIKSFRSFRLASSLCTRLCGAWPS